MKFNQWTLALAAAGVVSPFAVAQAQDAQHQVLTALSSTTLSGYVDTSASWRIGKTAGAIPGRVFDGPAKQDGFNLNAVKLTLEKPLDEGQWAAGYKVDLAFGPDANYYSTAGIFSGGADSGEFNIKQAYANFRIPVAASNGIEVKMGVFDTIIGYEVFESGNNPNSSRSFGFGIEPANHTGVLASYHIVENVSVSAGIADTQTGAINARPTRAGRLADQTEKTYMGSIAVTMPDSLSFLSGSTLYAGVIDGLAGGNRDTTSYYAGYTMNTPLKGLSTGIAFDYRSDAGVSLPSDWAWAAAVYAKYQATEKLSLAARADWTQGTDGTYYFSGVPGGKQNELFAVTLTADYNLWNGLITRLEGRWDRSINGDRPYSSIDGSQADRNVLTVALNAIYKF